MGFARRGARRRLAVRDVTVITVNVVLISPYEIGRQPFGLAEPAAWLREAGFHVTCIDLAVERLDQARLREAELVALYVAMHTATRIAVEALPRIRALAPRAHLCVYGLYAPMNAALFRELGAGTVLGGECEPALLDLALELRRGERPGPRSEVSRAKIDFRVPDRSTLPALERYAHLELPDGASRTVGFAEASRGCKHLCRHCPVVPVYEGRFRAVPVEVVMADVRNQVRAGAEHISFGDPDFFNGPTHALRVARALAEAFPGLTFDATIKIEHLIGASHLLPVLRECGCLFITSAVESVDERVLEHLAKGHTAEDFERAVALTREAGIALAPTFVPFTPWTTLTGYLELLERLVALRLVESVPPIQLAIRLLVPAGSHLFRIPGFETLVEPFDGRTLGHPWRHPDPRVDRLQAEVQALVERAEEQDRPRGETFGRIWTLAHRALGRVAPRLRQDLGDPVPRLSEPWYCCAEPTRQQLQAF